MRLLMLVLVLSLASFTRSNAEGGETVIRRAGDVVTVELPTGERLTERWTDLSPAEKKQWLRSRHYSQDNL